MKEKNNYIYKNKKIDFSRIKNSISTFFIHAIPIVIAIVAIMPFIYIFLISIQHVFHLQSDPRLILPREPTLDTYLTVFKDTGVLRWISNSLLVATSVTAVTLVIHSAAGYAFYKNRFNKFINILFNIVLIGIMIPRAVTILPTFLLVKELHLLDTYFALILPPLALPVGIFLIRQAMYSFPMALVDSAKIDGCSEIGSFFRIVFPILKPSLVVLGIYTFMEQWRDFIWPLISVSSESKKTIPVGLSTLVSVFRTDYGVYMATLMTTMLPSMIVFLIFQQYFIKGLTAGALKE